MSIASRCTLYLDIKALSEAIEQKLLQGEALADRIRRLRYQALELLRAHDILAEMQGPASVVLVRLVTAAFQDFDMALDLLEGGQPRGEECQVAREDAWRGALSLAEAMLRARSQAQRAS